MGRGKNGVRGYSLEWGRRGLARVGVGVGRAVAKLPCTKFVTRPFKVAPYSFGLV